ncbi:MAG: mechanosensitive ion channel domain-containing protein [Myxococcota bacterium]
MKRVAPIAVVIGWMSFSSMAWGQDVDVPDISQVAKLVRWTGLLLSIFVILFASILLRFVSKGSEQLAAQFANRRLTIQKLESFTRFFIYFLTLAATISLSFRIDKTALAIVGGAIAFAVGFAMRDLVAAVIAGVMIMFDRPFQVGDRVEYAGQYGDIIQIGLRSVRMCTLDDNIVTIPNNKILTDVTSSGNYGALTMQVSMEFLIGVDQDFDLAERLVRESILTSRYVYLESPVAVLVEQKIKDEYVAISIKGKAYVFDTKYEKAFVTDVNKRVLRAFRKHGIQPPAILHRFDAGQVADLASVLGRRDAP